MDLRLDLYRLAAEHRLAGADAARLEELAGLHEQPARLAYWLPRGVALLASTLLGLGLIFWVAANWDALGRSIRFGLLQGLVAATCAAAFFRPPARAPLGLLALLTCGGLFAYFGQTYQTGADAWQLFALWALLALPLAWGVRSDIVWAPWSLVALSAISLWVHAHAGQRWRVEPQDLQVHLLGWGAALTLAGALSAPLRTLTGAGVWSLRTALTLSVAMIGASALFGLFGNTALLNTYWLGMAALGAVVAGLSSSRLFDLFGLSAAALALDVLLVSGLVRWLFDSRLGLDLSILLLLTGLVAAGLLAASVSLVMQIARARAKPGEQA